MSQANSRERVPVLSKKNILHERTRDLTVRTGRFDVNKEITPEDWEGALAFARDKFKHKESASFDDQWGKPEFPAVLLLLNPLLKRKDIFPEGSLEEAVSSLVNTIVYEEDYYSYAERIRPAAFVKLFAPDLLPPDLFPDEDLEKVIDRGIDTDTAKEFFAVKLLYPHISLDRIAQVYDEDQNSSATSIWKTINISRRMDNVNRIDNPNENVLFNLAGDLAYTRLLFPETWEREVRVEEHLWEKMRYALEFYRHSGSDVFMRFAFFLTIMAAEKAELTLDGKIQFKPHVVSPVEQQQEKPPVRRIR